MLRTNSVLAAILPPAIAILAVSCTADSAQDPDESSATEGSSTTDASLGPEESSTTGDPPGSEGSSSAAGTTVLDPETGSSSGSQESSCGDGEVEGDEVCDEGEDNGEYGAACNADCSGLGPRCGDGEVNGDEVCDDGNEDDDDTCSSGCSAFNPLAWVWIEPTEGAVYGIHCDDAGLTTAVGVWGDYLGIGVDDAALVRQFDLDGTVVLESNPAPDENSILQAVKPGPDGELLAFGGTGRGWFGWIHTLGDGVGQDTLFDEHYSFDYGDVGPDGWAAISGSTHLVHRRLDGTTSTYDHLGIEGLVYEEAGTIVATVDQNQFEYEPHLVRFGPDLEIIDSIPLGSGVTSVGDPAPTADGGILVSVAQSGLFSSYLRRYDADLNEVSRFATGYYGFKSIAEVDGRLVMAGTHHDGRVNSPIVGVVNETGEFLWGGVLPAAEYGYESGSFGTVSVDPEGGLVAGGMFRTGNENGFQNGHPVVARFVLP